MNQRYVLRPDTQAWVGQAWGFFSLACTAEMAAIWWLDLTTQLKLLLTVILAATIYICFSLAKTIRDNRDGRRDTDAWIGMTYGMAMGMVCALAYGIFFVSPDWKERLLLGIGLAWTIEATLVLAKTIRDQHEARQDAARIAHEETTRRSHEQAA
jgi:hypothetical protein